MRNITMGMFALAALVGMATISVKTARAEAGVSLEGAKQESGVEFGEIAAKRGGSSAVSASGDGVSRATLTPGKLNRKGKHEKVCPPPHPGNRNIEERRPLGEVLGTVALLAISGAMISFLWLTAPYLALSQPNESGVIATALIGVGAFIGGLIGLLYNDSIRRSFNQT